MESETAGETDSERQGVSIGGSEPKPRPGTEEATVSEQLGGEEIELAFTGSAWCHVVYRSGATYAFHKNSGDTLRLVKTELQALIIGNPNLVELRDRNGVVDLQKFYHADKHQVRILGAAARAL